MIVLSSVDLLTAVLGAPSVTSSPQFYVAYFDSSPDSGLASYGDVSATILTGTTPVNVVPPPPNVTMVRNLAAFYMVNTDTAPLVFSLLLGGSVLARFQMAVGDNLSYTRVCGEFKLLDATGALKQTVSMPNVAITNGANTFSGQQNFSGLIVPSGGIKGTFVADSSPAGCIGEVITTTVAAASAIALATATPANVISIALTAGDWDVDGSVCFTLASTTTMGYLTGGLSTVSATLPLNNAGRATLVGAGTNATTDVTTDPIVAPSRIRVNSASATTTVYLVAQAKFAVSTCKAYGTIYARRAR
jgi:hypothetical protein